VSIIRGLISSLEEWRQKEDIKHHAFWLISKGSVSIPKSSSTINLLGTRYTSQSASGTGSELIILSAKEGISPKGIVVVSIKYRI
jgi:hypothetical protein